MQSETILRVLCFSRPASSFFFKLSNIYDLRSELYLGCRKLFDS